MKKFNLKDMTKGWFVGNFNPTAYNTDSCEIAIKHYKAGNYEQAHHHRMVTEITVIIFGKVEMNGVVYEVNDVIVIEPHESTDFKALEDTITCVYKSQSVAGDKYID